MRRRQYGIASNKRPSALDDSTPPSNPHVRQCWQGRTRNRNSADNADAALRGMRAPTQNSTCNDQHYSGQQSNSNPFSAQGLMTWHPMILASSGYANFA